MKKALHAYYSGEVQGVGFRFTAQRIAEELKVTGWVKNLNDGRVEIIAEEEEENLKDFLSKISSAFSRYIEDVQIDWEPATGRFYDFRMSF